MKSIMRMNFNIGELREQIVSGRLKSIATESVIKQAGRNAETRLPEARKIAPVRDAEGPVAGRR